MLDVGATAERREGDGVKATMRLLIGTLLLKVGTLRVGLAPFEDRHALAKSAKSHGQGRLRVLAEVPPGARRIGHHPGDAE